MMRTLLVRGLLAGVLAGLAAAVFTYLFGEPALDAAIVAEHHSEAAGAALDNEHGPELVGRAVQSTLGLGVAAVVYGAAVGGIFALAYAIAHGRLGPRTPRATAAVLALGAFLVVFLVPFLKYPANPPGASDPATISQRTGLYLLMVALSVALALAATALGHRLVPRLGGWNATLAGAGVYLVAAGLLAAALPVVNETPPDYPATVLYQFRMATIGGQALLWTVLGLLFGALVHTTHQARPANTPRAAAPGQ